MIRFLPYLLSLSPGDQIFGEMLPIDILTHWGRVTHICVSKLTIIGSDNGLSPGRRQAMIWTNAGILLIGPLGTNFSEILIEIYTFSFKKMHLKMLSGNWRPSCLGFNVLIISHEFPCIRILRDLSWQNSFWPTEWLDAIKDEIPYWFEVR